MKYIVNLTKSLINIIVDGFIVYLMFHYKIINSDSSIWTTIVTVIAALFIVSCVDYAVVNVLSRNYGELSDAEIYKRLLDLYKNKQESWWSDTEDEERGDDPNEDDVK